MSGPQHPFPTGFPTAQQQAMRTQFGGGQMVPGLMGPQQPGMVSPQQFGVAGNPMGMPNPQQVMAQQQQQQQQLAVQQSVTMQMQQMQQQQQQMQLQQQQQVNLVPQTAQVQAVAQIQPGGQVQPVSQVQQQPQQTQQQQQQPQTQSQQSQQAQPQQQSQPQQQQVQQQQTVQPGQNVQQQQQQQQQQAGQSGQAGQPGQQQQQQQQQPNKEFNTVSLCKFGQETVQDLVSRTLEIFQTLKVFQPPNGTAQGANMANDKKSKVQEQLRMIKLLFRRLRLIYEKCNENCQLQGMEYTHIESLIPLKEEWDMKSEEKKTSEAYRIAFEDSKEATEQVIAKNRHLKEIIDHLRRIISEINTMLHMRRS